MALNTTTLSTACAVTDNAIVVASATGFVAGKLVVVDQEQMQVGQAYVSGTTIPVLRGREGTVTAAHVKTANVITELATDLAGGPVAQTAVQWPTVRARTLTSYTTLGAITMPVPGSDAVAVLNSTVALAMTLANPTTDMDGSLLIIVGNGKAAHTVTYTAGLGNIGATADVLTFHATMSQGVMIVACGGFWTTLQFVAGAATVAGPGIG